MTAMFEQLSLLSEDTPEEAEAIRCMDGKYVLAVVLDSRMKRLVPNGEYVVMVGVHPLVLRPVKFRAEEIPEGHHYYHYLIGGRVYAGIFVGS